LSFSDIPSGKGVELEGRISCSLAPEPVFPGSAASSWELLSPLEEDALEEDEGALLSGWPEVQAAVERSRAAARSMANSFFSFFMFFSPFIFIVKESRQEEGAIL